MSEAILKDLQSRKLTITALICEDDSGKLYVLNYDENDKLSFISAPVDAMTINEKLGESMSVVLAEINAAEGDE